MSKIIENICSRPKHILELNLEDKRKFLESFDIILSDCDGVIWMFSESIPNVGAAINLLKNVGKDYKFVSNNGMISDEDYLNKLEKIGAKNISKDDFIIPYKVLARYLKLHYPNETCYCLGTETFCNSLKATGIKVLNVTPSGNLTNEEIRVAVTPSESAKVVAVDIHFNMTHLEFALIHQYLAKDDCVVFINAMDDRAPMAKDLTIVGVGLFIKALVDCVTKEPVITGKPGKLLAEYMVEELQIKDRKRGLFVGDNLTADIEFAGRLGFQTLFVLNGAHTKEKMLSIPLEDQPDYYADSLGDFVEFFNHYNLINNVNE